MAACTRANPIQDSCADIQRHKTAPGTVMHHSTWGRLPLLLRSLGHCVLPEPIGWLWLQLDFLPSVAELFRLLPLKSVTLYRNTSSQLPRCSPWKRFHYNNLSVYSTLVDVVVISVTYATLKNHWLIDWLKASKRISWVQEVGVSTALWPNKYVFSYCLKRLCDKSGCLRSVGRLFQTRGPAALKALSPNW